MANTLEIILRARDEASNQLKVAASNMSGLTNTLKQHQQALTMVAVGGGAMAAALGLFAKAAADEETNVIRLSVALRNVGVSYDSVKDTLERVIAATERKTGIADDQQRNALQRLIIGTSDYNEALRRLPIALDLAAATGMDAAMAGQLLGRITDETTSILTRYGITLKGGVTATEALAAIQQKVGGTAEEMGRSTAGAFNAMKAAMGDVMESFGNLLLPIVEKAARAIEALAIKIQEIPGWLKTVGLVLMGAAAAGGLVAGLGLLIIQAQKGITAILGLARALGVMQAMMGPKGWVTLAIGTGLAIAIDQMDLFKAKGVDAFESVADAGVRTANKLIAAYDQVHLIALDQEKGMARVGGVPVRSPAAAAILGGQIKEPSGAIDKLITAAAVPLDVAKFLAELTSKGLREWWENQEQPLLNVLDLTQFQEEAVEAQRKAAEIAWANLDKEVVTFFDPIVGEWRTVMKAQMTAEQSLANMQADVARYELSVLKEEASRKRELAALDKARIELEKAQAEERHKLWLQKEGFYAGALATYIQAGGQAQLMAVGGTPAPVDDPMRRADINRQIQAELTRTGMTTDASGRPIKIEITVRDETGRALSLLGTEVNNAARVQSE